MTRHIWGDKQSGEVFDWIYASTDLLHVIVFGLPPHGSFRHSETFRTIFGADELLHVISGTMIIANPETAEVMRVPTAESAFFRQDTWHHVHAHGPEPLRVLELLAPPPSAGTTGAYARTRDYLHEARYRDDSVLGHLPRPAGQEQRTLTHVGPDQAVYRLEGQALVGLLASTEHLTAASLSLAPGGASDEQAHQGDELVFVTKGVLTVRAWHLDMTHVFELAPNDAAFIPAGARHEYRNYGGVETEAVIGVAPSYAEPLPA